jgi:hypothetical protein
MTFTVLQSKLGKIDKTVTDDSTTYRAWFKGKDLGVFATEDEAQQAIQDMAHHHG